MSNKADDLEREFRQRSYEAAIFSIGADVCRIVLMNNPSALETVPAYSEYIHANFEDFRKLHETEWKIEPRYSAAEVENMVSPSHHHVVSGSMSSLRAIEMHENANRVLKTQEQCDHLKENQRTRLIAFRTSDDKFHAICNLCFKQWGSYGDIPFHIRPNLDGIGHFNLGVDNG